MDCAQLKGVGGGESKTDNIAGSFRDGGFATIVPDGSSTTVDIVAVPAICADPKTTWIPFGLTNTREHTRTQDDAVSHNFWLKIINKALSPEEDSSEKQFPSFQELEDGGYSISRGPWLTHELRKGIPQARVLLYDHGNPEEGDTFEVLAERLLRKLSQARKAGLGFQDRNPGPRPVFFICHSTGGLVAKQALVMANKRTFFAPIAEDCYGVTFIATPHQGSTYLAAREFWPSVQQVMSLRCAMPHSLQRQFHPNNPDLQKLAAEFKTHSTDLRINTYYETSDSELGFTPANDNIPRSYHGFITSVASAILDLEQESETPLAGDHVECARFQGDDDLRNMFILELRKAVLTSEDLSKLKHNSIDLETEVKIEVNGFFEDASSSVKLWTARPSLKDYLKDGPRVHLEARMKQAQGAAKPSLMTVNPIEDRQQNDSHITRKTSIQLRASSDPQDAKTAQDLPTSARRSSATPIITFSEPKRHPKLNSPGSTSPIECGPPLPPMEQLKLTWVHLPYTHTGWVRQVLNRISEERGIDVHSDFLKEEHWASNHNHGRHAAPHAKFVKSSFVDLSRNTELLASDTRFSIYLQYLHWDTYKRLVERRSVITRRLKQGRVRPIHENIEASESIETKMIWKYIGLEDPFHCRRTLDQYGYPNLRSTKARDDDQMLWKRTRPKALNPLTALHAKNNHDNKSSANLHSLQGLLKSLARKRRHDDEEEAKVKPSERAKVSPEGGNVLMIDQLWLWVLDPNTIVTFFPKKETMLSEGRLYQQADLYDDIYNEVNSGLQTVPDAETFASLIVQRAITILLDRTAHRHLQVLRIYEESISILIERMTRSYKSFRKEGFSVRSDAYNRNRDGEPMTLDEKQGRDLDVEKQSKGDFSSLLELRDVYDELHTVKKLFKEQKATLNAMAKHYGGPTWPVEDQALQLNHPSSRGDMSEIRAAPTEGLKHLEAANQSIRAFEINVSDMIESAENAEKAYSSLLDIKQKQANVDESRLARSQVDATASQGRSIMVFTIFTIIFLPLSFFTSLFGMNIREWSDPNQPPPLHKVVNFIGPISVGVIFIALTLAFSNTIRAIAVIARKVITGIIRDLYHLVAWPLQQVQKLASVIYVSTPVWYLQKEISKRYLQREDQYVGGDYDVWEDYAQPQHKSSRDMANENSRVLTSQRMSWIYKIKGEKSF